MSIGTAVCQADVHAPGLLPNAEAMEEEHRKLQYELPSCRFQGPKLVEVLSQEKEVKILLSEKHVQNHLL